MKKFIALSVLAVVLTGCGSKEEAPAPEAAPAAEAPAPGAVPQAEASPAPGSAEVPAAQ